MAKLGRTPIDERKEAERDQIARAAELLALRKNEESYVSQISKRQNDILQTIGRQSVLDRQQAVSRQKSKENVERQQEILSGVESIQKNLSSEMANQFGLSEKILPYADELNSLVNQRNKLESQILAKKQETGRVENAQEAAMLETLKVAIDATKEAQERRVQFEKIKDVQEKTLELFGLSSDKISEIGSKIDNVLSNPLILIVGLLGMALVKSKEMMGALGAFRKETGLTVAQTDQIEKDIRNTSQEMKHLGVGYEEAANAAKDLFESMGNTSLVTKQNIQFVADMNARLGVSTSSAAAFVKSMSLVGKDAAAMGVELTKIATESGVSTAQVMSDIAESSEDTYAFLSKNPNALIRTAVQARKLGMNMKQIADITEGLLDIETSLNAEMEASILSGKVINLDAARYYALIGDQEGALREVTKQFTSLAEFNKMGPIAQKAYAAAVGMTSSELARVIMQKEKEMKMSAADKKLAEERAKREATIQGTLEKTANIWKAIISDVSTLFMPVIEAAVSVLEVISGVLAQIRKLWIGVFGEEAADGAKKISGYAALIALSLGGLAKMNFMGLGFQLKKMWAGMKPGWMGGGGGISDSTKNIPTPTERGPGALGRMTEFMKTASPKNILATGVALIMFAGAIWILSKAFQNFSEVTAGGFVGGIIAMGLFTLAFIGISTALTTAGPVMVAGSVVLLAFAGAIWVLSDAMEKMSNSADGLSKILWTLSQVNAGNIFAVGGALYAVAGGLGAMAVGTAALGVANAIFGGGGNKTAETKDGTSQIISKLDELKFAFENKSFDVYLDGRKVNMKLAETGRYG